MPPRVRAQKRPRRPKPAQSFVEGLGKRVRDAYVAAGYTRAAFARAIGAQYTSVERWDRGAAVMSLPAAIRVAQILDLSLDDLVFGEDQPTLHTSQDTT